MKSDNKDLLDSSVTLLVAEHNRLSGLYQLNAELGDKYVAAYLTTMSLTIAFLVGVNKFGGNPLEAISLSIALAAVLFAVGLTVFHRLVDRRIHMIEYLRAINRIHHYFASRDNELNLHLYWDAYDDHPPLHTEGTFLGGLRNIIGILNSFSAGITIYLIIRITWPSIGLLISIVFGLIRGMANLVFLAIYDKWLMRKADLILKQYIGYPHPSLHSARKTK